MSDEFAVQEVKGQRRGVIECGGGSAWWLYISPQRDGSFYLSKDQVSRSVYVWRPVRIKCIEYMSYLLPTGVVHDRTSPPRGDTCPITPFSPESNHRGHLLLARATG